MRHLNENYSSGNNIAVLSTVSPSEMGKIFSYNGLWANMHGETSAYILGSSLFADIKNPQTIYLYKSVALQK